MCLGISVGETDDHQTPETNDNTQKSGLEREDDDLTEDWDTLISQNRADKKSSRSRE